ncbi:molybdopterin oxidoreductase [Rubellimicrobium rubrum]|uniref:Molybdopterin oxidoreductase n=1 Tax=Rubellimicrobium rubrum TaxID=2585369 RepID=A0A5C4MXA1_9RHOB|nr:molybdopterin-dependent oxidoreductase [Rubellimicrobium rubrum]TNC48562.1 molybdopterin oxidoreductase [Rubellimicrobium rubrum]
MTADPTRRLLLGGLLATPALLSGCKVLDGLSAVDHPLRNVMEGANRLTHKAQQLAAGDALAPEYTRADIRQGMRPNGTTNPSDADYQALAANAWTDWRLTVSGAVERPLSLSLAELMAMPSRTQITRHDCVEGWSCIAEWTGVPLSHVLSLARPTSKARFVYFRSMDTIERGLSGSIRYWESHDLRDSLHPQTILAYGMNGVALPVRNGAPLRLRVERQLGYKMAKYLSGIEVVPALSDKGGYWEERGYDWYAGL